MDQVDTLPVRIRSKIDVAGPDDCWPWNASTTGMGYGKVYWEGHVIDARRLVYTLLVGPIPERHVIDHRCHDDDCPFTDSRCPHRRCVNPRHLWATTQRKNVLRGHSIHAANARKTHCAQGHEFTPENTKLEVDGTRKCRECMRKRDRVRYARRHPGAGNLGGTFFLRD